MMPTDLICYYPTNIAVIDDSESFLAMLNKELDLKQPRRLYNDPIKALNEINTVKKTGDQLNYILKKISIDDMDELQLDYNVNPLVQVNINNIYKEISNIERFNNVSVLLVDYRMKQMNGLEFCQNISDKNIIKIMVTEISDYKLAIKAFNEGIINKFILKNTPEFFKEINMSINKGKEAYFNNIYGLNSVLRMVFRYQKLLGNENYSEFTKKINDIIAPVEYYLLDKFGSTLFLSEKGDTTWFIVRTKNELEELYAVAKDNGASVSILNALKNKQGMPILLQEKDYKESVKNWYIYPIKPLLNQEAYYSLIINYKLSLLDSLNIASFEHYIEKHANRFYKKK